MNLEFEVKSILRSGMSPEETAERIMEFATFNKEDIIAAIKEGGKTPSDVYGNLLNLSRRRNQNEVSGVR